MWGNFKLNLGNMKFQKVYYFSAYDGYLMKDSGTTATTKSAIFEWQFQLAFNIKAFVVMKRNGIMELLR